MAEVPGSVQGQPTPEGNISSQPGDPPNAEFGEKPTNDADALRGIEAQRGIGGQDSRNEPYRGDLPPGAETFAEKPTNDYENFRRFQEDLKRYVDANYTPEQQAAFERAIREQLKQALGVTDTADLNPQARKLFETYRDWFLGKIAK